MKCKVCNRAFEKHSPSEVDACVKKGFGFDMDHIARPMADAKIIESMSQSSSDKRHFDLVLKSGEVIPTDNLQMTFAMLLLTRVYEKKGGTDGSLVVSELSSEEPADPDANSEAEEAGMG